MTKHSGALHVLVVEDEPLMRWSVTEMLADAGHAVSDAADATSAVDAVANADEPFDVVLLDLCLPDSDDLTLLATLRRMTPASAVVIVTAFGSPEMAQRARDLGVRRVLDKPFDVIDINSIVVAAAAA